MTGPLEGKGGLQEEGTQHFEIGGKVQCRQRRSGTKGIRGVKQHVCSESYKQLDNLRAKNYKQMRL